MAKFSHFEGKWKQVSSENFEEYMKAAGVGMLARMAASRVTVTLEIHVEGDKCQCKQMSTFKNTELNFTLGEEFEETTPDGRKFHTTVYEEDGKMVQHQMPVKKGDVESKITRWVEGNLLHVLMEADGVQCKRVYERV